jgi:predicted peroxiredoxin
MFVLDEEKYSIEGAYAILAVLMRRIIYIKEQTMSRVLIKSAWGSDDPTKAAFPFLHANAFAEAGHEVQIFLLGEAVGLMRSCVAEAVVPVGWPPLAETLTKTIELGTKIHI